MKHLLIKLGDTVMFDGEVVDFQWNESGSTVAAKASTRRQPTGGGGALLDLLAGAAKSRPRPVEDAVEAAPQDFDVAT